MVDAIKPTLEGYESRSFVVLLLTSILSLQSLYRGVSSDLQVGKRDPRLCHRR
jgi:hypothetical protein